jgi:hypothetical protein
LLGEVDKHLNGSNVAGERLAIPTERSSHLRMRNEKLNLSMIQKQRLPFHHSTSRSGPSRARHARTTARRTGPVTLLARC